MKRAFLMILSALLVMGSASCSPREPSPVDTSGDSTATVTDADSAPLDTETDEVTDHVTTAPETETTEPSEPAVTYVYQSEHYTITESGATAEKIASGGSESTYGGAFYESELIEGDFRAEARLKPGTNRSEAGILFRAVKSESGEGFEGYAFTVRQDCVYLYQVSDSAETGMNVVELARRCVGNMRDNIVNGCTLRVEKSGNTFRLYYCDDMEGVEPWPEFEFVLEDVCGSGIGYFDNGRGATFDKISVEAIEPIATEGQTYLNPVFDSADPYILYHDGLYYCYATSAPVGYYVYTSPDLVTWTNEGLCAEQMWGFNQWYWAPEVIERDGKFYMIATVNEHIGIAVADSPLGPFIPEENWLYEKSIDGHIFVDDDGRAYLFYVSWQTEYAIYGCELNSDMTVKPGTTKQILKAKDPWEQTDGGCVEGPYMLKHNGTYYLTYSGTVYTSDQYAVGYATADSPLGDFTRYEANPILSFTSEVHGPGHHSFTTSSDGSELWIVYHRHNSTEEIHPRMTCIDRVRFAPTESGVDRLECYGPTHTPQPYPGS